jgi:hypothetical protein
VQGSENFLEFPNCFCIGKVVDWVHGSWTIGFFSPLLTKNRHGGGLSGG